jgi:Protein of unknown function (DUF2909)
MAIKTTASNVVNGLGKNVRDPSLIGTIYCLPSRVIADRQLAFKYLIVAMLALILISLGKALFHLSRSGQEDGKKMVASLAWRIGLSVALFVLLLVAYYYGWIHPAHDAPKL